MPKKILLIENDSAFAGQLVESLEASGFDARVAPEAKAGLDLAREWSPDGIVLCVELPGMSGYLVCRHLRKDEATRSIPLVLTSAEATTDTFASHKALKLRADEYLLKPFVPGVLLDTLAALGLGAEDAGSADEPPAPLPAGGEELISLEAEMGLEALSGEPSAELPSLDLESLQEEPAAPATGPGGVDDDLAFLDEAFEGIAAPAAASARKAPVPEEEEEAPAAAASLPDEDDSAARAALGELELAEDDPLAGLTGDDAPADDGSGELELDTGAPAVRSPSTDALRAAGIPLLEDAPSRPAARTTLAGIPIPGSVRPAPAEPPRSGNDGAHVERLQRELSEARSALAAHEAESKQHLARADEAAGRAASAEAAASEREAELASLRARLDAASGQARKAEQDLKAARDEARRAAGELQDLRARLAEAERGGERIEELERELESTRTELLVARNEVEGARGEVDARTGDLRKRLAELEAQNAKNEERVLKAYQKIKGDEKVKDKVRKAIAIAAQLLEEGLPAEPAPTPPEKPRLS